MQTETLNNKTEELRALNEHTQSSMTSEMIEVQMKITELENVKVSDLQRKVLQTAHSHSDSVIIDHPELSCYVKLFRERLVDLTSCLVFPDVFGPLSTTKHVPSRSTNTRST